MVVNVPRSDQVKIVDYCGLVSGRDEDKFSVAGLTPAKGQQLAHAPLVAECPVNLECRIKDRITLGSHDLFIGEIVGVHVDEEALDERGRLDVARLDPLAYVAGQYWKLGERLGLQGLARHK